MLEPGATLLFQGDSITDAGRIREDTRSAGVQALGGGYAKMAAAALLDRRPADRLRIFNRGVSGNRVVDLYARILADTINLKPDVVSVLIGVNDTWHAFKHSNGVPVDKYERLYRAYLAETRDALPGVRFVLCDPFVLPCGVVEPGWRAEIDARCAAVRRLAAEFGAVHVAFQEIFDRALADAPADYWAPDGVHPSAAGHHRMAAAWLRAIGP